MRSASEVVVITGASAGVGRATARAFGAAGARVALLARGADRLEAARREVEELGGKAIAITTDVADADAVERAAASVEHTWGPIDIWINNAMVSVFSPVKDMTADEFARVTQVTYLGTVHGTLAALRRMLPRNRGAVVQVGSALAYRGIPLQSAYCAAKHAVEGFCDSLRTELLHDGSRVRLTMVQLPALNTPQFMWTRNKLPRKAQPVPPIFQPEVAARAIVWAAHHDRPEVKVGWPTVKAIVGNKLAPRLADRYLARSGYQLQQTDEHNDPNQPDNLFVAPAGDPGARGPFSDRARSHSPELWLSVHRLPVGIAAGVALALVGLGWRKAERRAAGR
jgi:NADP-dependent 3-hydroxy acid dehydrogenase YdfG